MPSMSHGQLHVSLQGDPRIRRSKERMHAKLTAEMINRPIDLITCDTSSSR